MRSLTIEEMGQLLHGASHSIAATGTNTGLQPSNQQPWIAVPMSSKTKAARRRSRTPKNESEIQSPLEAYLREINDTPLLTPEEEQELAIAVSKGDPVARDRMVRANLRLVVNIARSYTGKGLSLQDLIEEGNLGLLRAVEGFDPGMGTRFSTYASYWIKQSIKRALINSAKTIRIPAYMVELLSKWRRASTRLAEWPIQRLKELEELLLNGKWIKNDVKPRVMCQACGCSCTSKNLWSVDGASIDVTDVSCYGAVSYTHLTLPTN